MRNLLKNTDTVILEGTLAVASAYAGMMFSEAAYRFAKPLTITNLAEGLLCSNCQNVSLVYSVCDELIIIKNRLYASLYCPLLSSNTLCQYRCGSPPLGAGIQLINGADTPSTAPSIFPTSSFVGSGILESAAGAAHSQLSCVLVSTSPVCPPLGAQIDQKH